MIGIGIIGAGVMGASHVTTLAGLGGARVVAVADPDGDRAGRAAALADARTASIEALIADAEVQAVVVASPDENHAAQVLACLAAGKPVLCEKPLAATLAEGRAIVEADAGRGLVQVGFMRRYDPDYRELRAGLDGGAIGMPILMRMIHRNAVAPAFMRDMQGITNAMVHEFDILRWLLRDDIARIRVNAARAAPQSGLVDPLLATVETTGGRLVEIENANNVRYGYDIRTEILGTDGVLRMAERPAVQVLTAGGATTRYPADFTRRFSEAYRLQFSDWLHALAAGRNRGEGATAEDGLIAMTVAAAGVRALETGDWVEINPDGLRSAA